MHEDVPLAVPELTGQQLTAGCRPAPPQAGWVVDEPRWDAYYAVVFVACLAIVQAGPLPLTGRIIATVALTAMVPWYIFLGRPLMQVNDPTRDPGLKGTIYLAGLIVLFATAQSQDPNTWFLAFGLLPQCFQVTTLRRGMVFVVILNVTAGALEAWRNPGCRAC